ncbi:MAG: hypothetical protein CMQ20_15165 [Gammaproteobacteria bacterium]|jgi:hypothetical protein|nr:hypothetical protein [Gammaproteobacteria bacterium]|tara:strand:- start:10229 stop:11566 length:1338 start_codon:yes stop_codon:yes gene_type:complete
MKYFLAVCALLTIFFLSGCGSEDGFTNQPAPAGLLQVLNAIPDSPGLIVNYENQNVGFIEFGESTGFIQVLPLVTRSLRITSFENRTETLLVSRDVRIPVDNLLTAVIAGTMTSPELILVEDVPPEFADEGTISELRIIHAATSVQTSVNFHLTENDAPAGEPTVSVPLNSTTELIRSEASETSRLRAFDTNGETLWDSGIFPLAASNRLMFVLLDYFGPGDGKVRTVSMTSAIAQNFPNEVITSSSRFANMISDRTAVDIYLGGTLMAEDMLFGDVNQYQNLEAGVYEVTVTSANNIEDVVAETTFTAASGQFHSIIATGLGDSNSVLGTLDDLRRGSTSARIAFTNTSPSAGSVDLYLLSSGQSVDKRRADISPLGSPGSGDVRVGEGMYDLVLTTAGSNAIVFGPEPISVSNNGLYRIYLTDSAGGGEPIQALPGDEFSTNF